MTEKSKSKAYKIVNLSPFINRKSTLFVFSMILISLVPQIAMLFITKSFSSSAKITKRKGEIIWEIL